MRLFVPFLSGLLFSVGLAVAGMTAPKKIIDFLDVTGAWDPSLALVMVGAIAVFATSYWWTQARARKARAAAPVVATEGIIDRRLVVGSALFGVGWGLSGFCPGPALVAVASGLGQPLLFSVALLVGFAATSLLDKRAESAAAPVGEGH